MIDTTTPGGSRRMRTSVIVAGVTTAAAVAGLLGPAVSHAEKVWDLGSYDSCAQAASDRHSQGKTTDSEFIEEMQFCCIRSDGEWNTQAVKCQAPPATFQTAPQSPRSVVAPAPGKAALP